MQSQSHVLQDMLPAELSAVICGTAAGNESAKQKVYYADSNNYFWAVLEQVGLTPEKLTPARYLLLCEFGLGLTDLAKTVAGTDSTLSPGSFDVPMFKMSIERCQPRIVAFNGKTAARAFYGLSKRALLAYGPGPDIPNFPRIFVLPSTSGSARKYWDLGWWEEFARQVINLKVRG
jgi:TDG/mug DNA glycosylase family protein